MMKHNTMPRTPFSTPLSGSARETEIRLKHIFSGPKKRPPALFLALVFAVCIFCGNLVSCQVSATEAPEPEEWVNYLGLGELPWGEVTEIQMPEYPGVTFRCSPANISAVDRDGETILLDGKTIFNAYLFDLTGDGKRDFCASVTVGSGMADARIIVYDYAAGTEYTLENRMKYDYSLSLEDGQLLATRSEFQGGPPLLSRLGQQVYTGELSLSPEGVLEVVNEQPSLSPEGVLEVVNEQPSLTIWYQSASRLSPDLNHNGIPEEIRLENEYGWDEVGFYENGQLINRELPGVCLYSYTGGQDYILRCYDEDDYPGVYYHSYNICDVSGEFEEVIQYNSVSFDLNFNAPFHSFDPAAIAAYVEELTGPDGTPSLGLFSHAWRLVVRDGELVAEDPELSLPWLDQFPEVFTQDPNKSLEENLRDFQAAMTAAYPAPEPMGTADVLPFDQPMEMIFLSGAGAWCTGLDLNPDGTFTADYHDADGNILYVCQFHGKLGGFVQLTEHSWSLTLEELVLDTKYPVGTEWDEFSDQTGGPMHFISSEPHGFTDGDGNALQPGAQFILCSPETQGHAPGTELYGAYEFWTWWPDRHIFQNSSDTLGCWGLHNLASDIGFFSYD